MTEMVVVNKKNLEKYTSADVEFTAKLLESLDNRLKTIIEKEAINVSIPKHLDTNKPMWLATDKNGETQIIMCSDKPVRKEEYWAPGNGDYVQAYVDDCIQMYGLFAVFYEEARDVINKANFPQRYEDNPVEIELDFKMCWYG